MLAFLPLIVFFLLWLWHIMAVRTGDSREAVLTVGLVIITEGLSLFRLLTLAALLRWQMWGSRLHLTMFVLMSPLIAMALEQRTWLRWLIPAAMLALAMGPLLLNDTRPPVGERSIFQQPREAGFFVGRRAFQGELRQIVYAITGEQCSQVSLIAWDGSWDYPLWVMMNAAASSPVRMERVNIENADYPAGAFSPQRGAIL